MLEDQVAYLLQRYLGNYVIGLNKEALNISVWQGDVELTNMQLKPEALNALKLPVKVKAGFLGSVKLKVPWSRLGQDPVLVYLDRIFLLAEPATSVEGCSDDAIQEAKKSRVREMETKLLERMHQLKPEMNKSWLGSLISTIIGNLKLSISNIHIRYEDLESNPGHPFAAGLTLEKLSAVTVDDSGKETFVTGGALDRIQKSVELDRLALYLDSDISPWHIKEPWEDLLPAEWVQVFRFGTKDGRPADHPTEEHSYILQPVTGDAKYMKLRQNESSNSDEPLQKAAVSLENVTLCLSKDGYRDILKLADNFTAFNQRLKYAHYRPSFTLKSDPRSWWKYAYKAVSDQMKKASGKLSWEQVLKYTRLRKKYISLYASLLKSDVNRPVVDDNKEIEELDRELDIELILQWRMLAHKFLEQSIESENYLKKQKAKQSWWSFGWGSQSFKDETESLHFSEEEWQQLNKIIGYKEDEDGQSLMIDEKPDILQTVLEIHMKHNASKLLDGAHTCLADLSCEGLDCSIKLYPETKVFGVKLGSYQLSSPNGLLAQSATTADSLVGVFCYKPFDAKVDWSMVAKASPCYVTYLKDSLDEIAKFFESNTAVSHTIALETATAVQMTIDEVKRSAQQQVNRALKDHTRFLLDLDIAAPKITIPTEFQPDNKHFTKLLLDLGNLVIRSQDDNALTSPEELDLYSQFDLVLSDVSAFLVDGDYHWSQTSLKKSAASANTDGLSFLPVIDKCGVILKLQQIRLENPSYPTTRLAIQLPSLGFHFSPARYHRLMQVIKIFQEEENDSPDLLYAWNQADFEGWLSVLSRKGVGNREAVWQQRYLCLVGPFLYVLESPVSKSYKQYISLRGKHVYFVPAELVGGVESVLAVGDAARTNSKAVVEDANALILRCDNDDSRKAWHSRLQGVIYHTSDSAAITGLSETSSDSETECNDKNDTTDLSKKESVFITGVLDELKVDFSYNHQHERSFIKVLLAEEHPLFEFRALGGLVELSIKGNDMFIGTVLKSLEIEDLICCNPVSQPCYLARSVVRSADAQSLDDAGNRCFERNDMSPIEGDDKFYEAPEDLVDSFEFATPTSQKASELASLESFLSSEKTLFMTHSFSRVTGLLPDDNLLPRSEAIEPSDTLDSFVKAQIVIYDQNSPLYNNIDMKVTVTLSTLSFFCRRPTILAIMDFANAVTIEDETCESFSDGSSSVGVKHDISSEDPVDNQQATNFDEPVVKGLLGKGKSRIIFNLTLNMAHAQILLMNENETKLATLSQENLLTDIKVFPSSFSIKASLGNLRISDDSLPSSHMYFWICDMRDPGGTSFVELVFTSFSIDDEDYEGYEYSLFGQLSEVRIVYLNRFVQEVTSYFMGLVPNDSKDVKLKDQVTDSEKWFTTSEIEGSPAIRLDLSLRKPIILMPRRTDSLDYLKLDVVHITVKNTFQWFSGSKSDLNAVHLEIMTILVQDINLNVGTKSKLSESIIKDVKGVSIVIQRSLRDLMHQVPSIEAVIKIEELKADLSNRDYQIVTECALSNISETPHNVPPLNSDFLSSSVDVVEHVSPQNTVSIEPRTPNGETWTVLKVSVIINLVELGLYVGEEWGSPLATVQASGAWLLYKSNTLGEGFLSASLKSFSVIDDRMGTEEEFRLAIGMPKNPLVSVDDTMGQLISNANVTKENNIKPFPTMLLLDAKFGQFSTSLSVCVQRPQLLVALDFLLAVVEFFVPTVGSMLSNEEDKKSLRMVDAIILDKSTFTQPSAQFSLSPLKPLIADDEKYDNFIYDGNGGILHLKDREGFDLSAPSNEAMIYVGNGKKLQFKNVIIKNGQYIDSCISLGTNSCYSASKDDLVYLEGGQESQQADASREIANDMAPQNAMVDRSAEFIVEFQAIGPELTFYNASKDVGESPVLSNKLLHGQLDAFGRLVMKGDTMEMTANALGLTMESNGIRILEPFDTSIKYSNASGKKNMHLSVSNIFMNFSFSILRLFLAVEEDILAFLSTTSKEMTVHCSQFDKVGTIKYPKTDQIYAFWRARAPVGFAVLGDYLTPLDKPPTKGVLAVNINYLRVKRPVSFKRIWPPLGSGGISDEGEITSNTLSKDEEESSCSVWFPEAPEGYVALGCVVSPGKLQPSLSSTFCILASFVSPCSLRDCITISDTNHLAFWRVDNSLGTFLPAEPTTLRLLATAYELRHVIIRSPEVYPKTSRVSDTQTFPNGRVNNQQSESSKVVNSGRRFEAVASFRLVWWNRGSSSRKQLSIWRPVVPLGMVYFGDIAVQGYEPPNTCTVLHDTGDDELFKAPVGFQRVGQIKKQRGMENISFWLPQAPPGYVSVGCIACKGPPKRQDFCTLRCMRSDMVSGDQFLEESVWDTSDAKFCTEPFSIWVVANDLGTFVVRGGFRKPPRRFALKLVDPYLHSASDDTVIDAEIGTFSVAVFDDYGGLMVPLFNISLSGIAFSLHGRRDYSNSIVSFSLAARSYNDKYESWEPIVEPVDAVLRYQYDPNAPGAASQLRFTSTKDLNLNISVSNANMIIQAYASWNNLSDIHQYHKRPESFFPTSATRSVIDVHHKRSYYIIPQNKLGQDIFIRATEMRRLADVIRMPSGDMKPIKVPVSKNMLDSHLNGKLCRKIRTMVTIIIADATLPRVEGLTSHHYTVAVRLSPDQSLPSESLIRQQSARTCGHISSYLSSDTEFVDWSEIFFFKVDSPDTYIVELIVSDVGKGEAIGFFSAPLNHIAMYIPDDSPQYNQTNSSMWMDLSLSASMNTAQADRRGKKSSGKLKCAVILSPKSNTDETNEYFVGGRKSRFIQISPSMEGPWTTVRLNYAAPSACWRLGNYVVASQVTVKDGNRYVNIRSLVSVHNNTDFVLDLYLVSKASSEMMERPTDLSMPEGMQHDGNRIQTDEFFETEIYDPNTGWIGSNAQLNQDQTYAGGSQQATSGLELPSGWEWVDDWHLDTSSANTNGGWVYAPNVESLKWPESDDSLISSNSVRRRKWIRNMKQTSPNAKKDIFVGQLKPDDTVPLPLSALTQSAPFVFQLRPSHFDGPDKYSWSSVVRKPGQLEVSGKSTETSEIYVSALTESEEFLCCTLLSETSSNNSSRKIWFCLDIQATEISKDIHSDPILDWSILVKSPLSITNYLPLTAEYSILEMPASGHFIPCSRGISRPGRTVNIYNANICNPLFFSLLPQRGWLPLHEAVLISHPHGIPSKTISLRSSISGRIVQLIIEQDYEKEQKMMSKKIKVYAPYWFSVSRCPPLTYRLVNVGEKKRTSKIRFPRYSKKKTEEIIEEITDEEMYAGHTIASAMNFNLLGLSVAITESSKEHFGPIKDLYPLGDMDGSLDIYAYNADGECIRLFVSAKPCPYQSVPTKVVTVRPYMTFTNRLGRDIYIKLSSEDEPKVLRTSDSRMSFLHCENDGIDKLQVRLEDTEWSFPVQIVKEDTISLVLRRHDSLRTFLQVEIRGYEEGSRFIVVFRVGSTKGPVRIENRTFDKTICIRQSGFGEYAWTTLEALSTTIFSWENPYGQKSIDAKIDGDGNNRVWKVNLERAGQFSADEGELGMHLHVSKIGNIKIVRFTDDWTWKSSHEDMSLLATGKPQMDITPVEIIIELGVVGVSVVDHMPKELFYLYLDRVFVSYSTGYDGGTTSRFKLILGYLQMDNQLPLTLMPVLLAPEKMSDIRHPVFKMTITMQNATTDGIQVYPYVYIRVTDKCWRLNIHEPIIWALVDLYNNLHLEQIPQSSNVTQVDPEIRVDLIDISEVRLKVSLETAPAQRPHGVLGVWSPILSAVGNAFRIQVHLRRVMRKDRFMRRSSIARAVVNRIWQDLIHNPLHLLFSVDVLGMTSSTLASLSKGFAELSTDGQFLQMRSKQVTSRRITGVGDGIIQGAEALAQGVAFGVVGVVRKPVENARQYGLLGLAQGIGRAFLGIFVQPVSGVLDFFSLTVDGIGASCSKCLEVLNNKSTFQRIRNPRAIRADGILREYSEKEATGQMVLYLAQASQHFGCTEIFKVPSKFAWSDHYEEHFLLTNDKIVLVTNKRVMLLQCSSLDKMDKKPCKIMWDVPWKELMALELANQGNQLPSHLLLHLKNFKRSESFVRVIKCNVEEVEGIEPQAVKICSVARKMWRMYQADVNSIMLKVPSSQRYVYFSGSENDRKSVHALKKSIIKSRELSSSSSALEETKFVRHSVNFMKIWSSERELKGRCSLCRKKASDDGGLCSIWRPICPDGYVSVGDIARVGNHPPNVAAVYRSIDKLFALPVGYDLVWRNCMDDYTTPVSIWYPRAPEGFISLGCVAVPGFEEPEPNLVPCVAEVILEETTFEEQKIWSAPESYPWGCHVYQVKSEALHFVALRESKEYKDWKPRKIPDHFQPQQSLEEAH